MGLQYQIVTAMALDLIIGDPRWLLHPARLIGQLASWLEGKTRSYIESEMLAGTFTAMGVVLVTCFTVMALLWVAGLISSVASQIMSILILFTTIAAKDLIKHSSTVYKELQVGNLKQARKKAGMMVGRSTDELEEPELIRATVESVAENMVDGVIAPIFYGLLFGPAGAMTYKAINTLDSMFGYKNERYIRFGKFSARLDDVANYAPARIGALVVPVAARLVGLDWKRSWKILWRDFRQHDSPNAGWPEAAFAGALRVRLGGRNVYGGRVSIKPYLGDALESFESRHITMANKLMLCSSLVFLGLGVTMRVLLP